MHVNQLVEKRGDAFPEESAFCLTRLAGPTAAPDAAAGPASARSRLEVEIKKASAAVLPGRLPSADKASVAESAAALQDELTQWQLLAVYELWFRVFADAHSNPGPGPATETSSGTHASPPPPPPPPGAEAGDAVGSVQTMLEQLHFMLSALQLLPSAAVLTPLLQFCASRCPCLFDRVYQCFAAAVPFLPAHFFAQVSTPYMRHNAYTLRSRAPSLLSESTSMVMRGFAAG